MITSAGIIPVRKVGDEYLFLLLRAYDKWDFPKGQTELDDDNSFVTALREAEEETTLTPNDFDFKWGKESYITEPYGKRKKICKYFIAETTKEEINLPVSPELGKPEHSEFKWVTYEEGMNLTSDRVGKALKWADSQIKKKNQ